MKNPNFGLLKLLGVLALGGGYIFIAYNYLYDFALTLKVEVVKAQIGILVNVSAILFGVMGAWLALIYPTAVEKIQGGKSSTLGYSGVDLQVIKNLVVILLFSTMALIFSMLTDLALTISDISYIAQYFEKNEIVANCALIVWFLFFVQISAISAIFISSLKLVFDLFISKAFSDLDGLLSRNKK